jgi:hypothetical protein
MDGKTEPGANVVKLNTTAGSGGSESKSHSPAPLALPDWLADWNAGETPPATAAAIFDVLAQVDAAIVPMSFEEFLEAVVPMGDLFGPPKPEMLAQSYEIVKEIPLPAFMEAAGRCMRECREFPMPVDLLQRADQYHRLTRARSRLETALWRLDVEEARRRRQR